MADDTSTTASPASAGVIDVAWELNVPVADVYVVGYGMRIPNDLTLETLAILKRCKRLFGGPPINAPAFGIPEMESLMSLYARDKLRIATYREMETLVLDAAATDAPVAFATYGSPMVGTYVAHRLLQEAPRRGLTVHVANAVSSFDGIWADFNIEPFFGFQIWEATAFVSFEVTPDTKAHLLLPQAPVFEVSTGIDPDTNSIDLSGSISKLKEYLLRFYPADHVVHFVTTSTGLSTSLNSIVKSVPLRDLESTTGHTASTLLVPRLEAPPRNRIQYDFDGPATSAARHTHDTNGRPDATAG